MRVVHRRSIATVLTALMVAGCSGSGGSSVAPIQGGAVPTATPTSVAATATPSSGASATPAPGSGASATPTPGSGATATPTAVPTPTAKPTTAPTPTAKPTATPVATATPTSGVPTPVPSGTGDTACAVANEGVPGIYTSVTTIGSVAGSTYTGTSGAPGNWSADFYTTPSPTPLPTATVTPVATPTPFATPTPVPTVTPTPNMYTIYNGTYFVPGYSGQTQTGTGTATYTASQTTGCFELILQQAVGGTAGQFRRNAAVAPTNEAVGFGDPSFLNDTQDTNVDAGELESFSITSLTPTTGNGTFTFGPSGGGTTVHGVATITGSESFVFSGSRRVKDALHTYYMLYRSMQWYAHHLHHA